MKHFILFITACLCCLTAEARAGSTLEATVEAANDGFVPALMRGDAIAASRPFASDAIFIGPGNAIIRGRDAIAAMLRLRLQHTKFLGGRCITRALDSAGSKAWETGSCTYTTLAHGSKRTSTGRFMTLWKRGDNGKWFIEVNVAE